MINAGTPFLFNTVKKMLLSSDNEISVNAGKALEKVSSPPEDKYLKKALLEQDAHIIKTVNKTLQKEVASQDKFVRRMRPTFGYIMAFTWLCQMLAVAYLMVLDTTRAVEVVRSFADLSMMWSVGLSVLGVYVYKRSDEKKKT